MNIVIDTSVIIAVIANEPEKKALLKATINSDLFAPSSVHWEIGNAFSAMLKRDRIDLKTCILALEIYKEIPIQFAQIDLEESLKIAKQFKIYAYDAYILNCALKYNCPLISLDKELIKLAKQMNINIIEVNL